MDTGAAFSVFPHSSDRPPCGPALAGAVGRPIPCWGEKQFHLSFNGKEFGWPFLLAAVQFPMIGVDFLRHYGLLVDPAGNRLVDRLILQAFCSSPLGDSQPVTALRTQPLLRLTGLFSQRRPSLGYTGLFSHLRQAGASLRGPTCKRALRVS